MKHVSIFLVLFFAIANGQSQSSSVLNSDIELNGTWVFSNVFFQMVNEGQATLQPFQDDFIKKVTFTEVQSNGILKRATIEAMNQNGESEQYEGEYIEFAGGVITLGIDSIPKIALTLYTIKQTKGVRWFSFSLSKDVVTSHVIAP